MSSTTRDRWATWIFFSVDAPSEDLACAKFCRVVQARLVWAQENRGIGVLWPTPLEARYLYHMYRPRRQADDGQKQEPKHFPTLDEIADIEGTEPVRPYENRLLIYHCRGQEKETWEQSVRWIAEAFEPPVRPDVRLVRMEEETLTHWS